ncbi:hypothetical protein CDAR_198031 [Caerostris darwini]|uniref:Uncharacterized protein n=1 Tax=Caerostris darwini TaxID=1538125 RepID=A0AAV4RI64_9ARAC|nr:hypothetical protein CDAR_198031 [Caerostris darwini]
MPHKPIVIDVLGTKKRVLQLLLFIPVRYESRFRENLGQEFFQKAFIIHYFNTPYMLWWWSNRSVKKCIKRTLGESSMWSTGSTMFDS